MINLEQERADLEEFYLKHCGLEEMDEEERNWLFEFDEKNLCYLDRNVNCFWQGHKNRAEKAEEEKLTEDQALEIVDGIEEDEGYLNSYYLSTSISLDRDEVNIGALCNLKHLKAIVWIMENKDKLKGKENDR